MANYLVAAEFWTFTAHLPKAEAELEAFLDVHGKLFTKWIFGRNHFLVETGRFCRIGPAKRDVFFFWPRAQQRPGGFHDWVSQELSLWFPFAKWPF